eukprot:TRINITY_DN27058_c0_g1_i1.p1 TRINITY_DN27058_c0_g1~~TRINITY_DN27058_c0_g1_i1.p1  ORF type:complete len:394 (+),score=96.44 TRINITY_DN27058_c0_g1_i1:133-1182(+)
MAEDATRTAFETFGEVDCLVSVPEFDSFVQVVFYDVRSAVSALKAFGEAGCAFGPQVGERTVELAGNVELSKKDFDKISQVVKSSEGDSYTLEFFDYRDAEHFSKKSVGVKKTQEKVAAPPGLKSKVERKEVVEPPPGLTAPPGLVSDAAPVSSEEDWQVVLRGLPGKLLSEAMLEAIFEQAGLEGKYSQFNINGGKSSSEVVVRFPSMAAAEQCLVHFSGCHWDKTGPVTAELIPALNAVAPASAPLQAAGSGELSADAPAFEPGSFSGFSVEAPVFVPTENSNRQKVEAMASKTSSRSDTSTEVGESEDEKSSGPAEVKASWTKPPKAAVRPRSGSYSSGEGVGAPQ